MDRNERIRHLCGQAKDAGIPSLIYGIVCSRLGRGLECRRRSFDYLQQAVLKTKRDGASLLVVVGTAPEPWVRRAAELFRLPIHAVDVDDPSNRDRVLIGLADRVFAVWVRRGGKIANLLSQRLVVCQDESTWVAVNDDPKCAAESLIRRGAVGWYLQNFEPRPAVHDQRSLDKDPLDTTPAQLLDDIDWSQYLVHCTRGRSGPLPGQTETQYRDEVLLGGEGGRPATAAETLQRILTTGWLVGAARVSRHGMPVVCWSAVPLPDCLARRTFRSHLGRWDYEPYGIAIRKTAATRLGILPVVYGTPQQRKNMPEHQQWRFQSQGKRVDWRSEKEWRCRGSLELAHLGWDEAIVFVGGEEAWSATTGVSRWPVVRVDTFLCTSKGVQ